MATWTLRGKLPLADDPIPGVDTQAIVDQAEAEVLADLEPPVDLTILFENSLA